MKKKLISRLLIVPFGGSFFVKESLEKIKNN